MNYNIIKWIKSYKQKTNTQPSVYSLLYKCWAQACAKINDCLDLQHVWIATHQTLGAGVFHFPLVAIGVLCDITKWL